MAQFDDEDKKEITQNNLGFTEEGVYEIQIIDVTGGVSDKGSEFFEFEVVGANGVEDKIRTYFTDGAKPYSFNTIRNIFVHNTKEENKDKVRDEVNNCKDTDALLKLCEALRGKDAWLLVQKNGTTYTSPKSGKTYENVNKNLYGYKPTFTPSPQTQAPQAAQQSGNEEITSENVDQVFPFGN